MSTFNEQAQEFTERFRQWPPILRWGLLAAVLIIVYLFWDGTIAPTAKRWEAQANSIQRQVQQIREREQIARQISALEGTIVALGEVREPGDVAVVGQALTEIVNSVVVGEFSVTNYSIDLRPSAPMPRGMLSDLAAGTQVMRLSSDVRFNSTPDDAIAIIAALESRPEIATINVAQIQRVGGRRVQVRLTIDAWALGGGTARPGRSA